MGTKRRKRHCGIPATHNDFEYSPCTGDARPGSSRKLEVPILQAEPIPAQDSGLPTFPGPACKSCPRANGMSPSKTCPCPELAELFVRYVKAFSKDGIDLPPDDFLPTLAVVRMPSILEQFGALPCWQSPGVVLRVSEAAAFERERLKLTLKRLRQKGACTETSSQSVIERACHEDAGLAYHIIPINRGVSLREFDDDLWMKAIEMLVCNKGASLTLQLERKHYAALCTDHLPLLYAFALVALLSEKACAMDLVESVYFSEDIRALETRNAEFEAELGKLRGELERCRSEAEFKSKSAGEREKRLIAERDAALADKVKLDKKVFALERRLVGAEAEPAESKPAESKPDTPAAETTAEEPEPCTVSLTTKDIPDFPDSGVFFVGGHKNLVNKLRALHPDWRFVCEDDSSSLSALKTSNGKVSLVVMYAKYISHSLYNEAAKSLPASVPLIHVDATNTQAIDAQIASIWLQTTARVAVNN